MVCAAAILSSTLALGLLKNAAPPNSSFVLSPFSLGSALSIVHDGAGGNTQKELTNFLLKGCSPADVTAHYTTPTKALFKQNSDVTIKTANRFYINKDHSLLPDYQKSVEANYHADVLNADFSKQEVTAQDINAFIEGATNGKIKDMIKSDGIDADAAAMLINAVYFLGNWEIPFKELNTKEKTFNGANGDRKEKLMGLYGKYLPVNEHALGTAVKLPYKGGEYSFFVVLPQPGTTLSQLKENLDGVKLNEMLSGSHSTYVNFEMPKFKLESKLDGVEVLQKMGVKDIFTDGANLSKVSSTPLKVSKIQHKAMIEVNERGTEAAAATVVEGVRASLPLLPPQPKIIAIDRPALYGIIGSSDNGILFLGQYA